MSSLSSVTIGFRLSSLARSPFLGLILLALVRDGLILNDVSVYWQGLIQAAILVAAVSFDVLTRRRSSPVL